MTIKFTKLSYAVLGICLFLNCTCLFAQRNLEWVASTSAPIATRLIKDATGATYTSGYFYGSMDFDPGPGVFMLTSDPSGSNFISKVDKDGNLIWAETVGGGTAVFDPTVCIGMDAAGYLYLAGSFAGTADFDPGPGTAILNGVNSDVFIAKLDTAGHLIWVRQPSGADYCEIRAIAVDPSGDVHLTGAYNGTMDFDPGPAVFSLNNSLLNVFVAKYDSSGNFLWAKEMQGIDGIAYSKDVKLDAAGDVYTTGYLFCFGGKIDFDPSAAPADTFFLTSAGVSSFISKLDASGNFIWAKQLLGDDTSAVQTFSIALDGSGNVLTTGSFGNNIDFDPGTGAAATYLVSAPGGTFVSKLDPGGNFLWAKILTGATASDHIWGNDVTVNDQDDIYVTGQFVGAVDFDPGAAADMHSYNGVGSAAFVLKLNSEGDFRWKVTIEGDGTVQSSRLLVDGTQTLYTIGTYNTSADFDPGPGVKTQFPAALGGTDSYLLKLSCNSSVHIDTVACNNYSLNGVAYNASGQYTQHFANMDGCDSIIRLNLTIAPLDMSVTQSGPVLTAANSSAVSYQWITCNSGTPVPGATNQSFTATTSGDYAVVIDQGTCTDTSSCVSVTALSIDQFIKPGSLGLLPNPTSGVIKINPATSFKNAALRLLNPLGQIVLTREHINGDELWIDLSGLPAGVYIAEVTENGKRSSGSIVKQ